MSTPSSSTSPVYPPIVLSSYSIIIEPGLLSSLPQRVRAVAPASKYLLITDSNLYNLYGQSVLSSFGPSLYSFTIVAGESSKSRAVKSEIEDFMTNKGFGRDSVIIAMGGGVVGDLAGFVAATYMRGIPFIQLPTSLLAMVDSSIGGKTGIDTKAGKNLIGAFHRPAAVFIDTNVLLTLPDRELFNGLAESIKAGAIASETLFAFIENEADRIANKDIEALSRVIYESARIKADVVTKDEFEGGLRAILNFGHTIGHAIEALEQPAKLHGECVAIGMMEEAILSRSMGLIDSAAIRRLDNCLRCFRLPTAVPGHLSVPAMMEKMAIDKKNKGGKKELVLLTSIGSVKSTPAYTTMIEDCDLVKLLTRSVSVLPGRATGAVAVPGSKSLSNRILLMAAMGRGPCRIRGLLHSQDTQVMLASLRELGVRYQWEDKQATLLIHGAEGKLALPQKALYLNNAGTASRFLTSLVCCVPHGSITLTGNARMQERPIGDLVSALVNNGHDIVYLNKHGCLPIQVNSVGGFQGGDISLRATISSQYVSAILLAAPHALKPVDLRLAVSEGAVVSKPFIDMTIQLMKQFNVAVEEVAPFHYRIANCAYDNPSEFLVEGDATSATYPLCLAAVTGGPVTVTNVGSASLQGDAAFCGLLSRMGCSVHQSATATTVTGPASGLTAISVDLDSMTDTFMSLAAVAAFASGTTRITNIANQRVKECNRLAAMVCELAKVGVRAVETQQGIDIIGAGPDASGLLGGHIDCYDDHRIAMSFSIIASRVGGVRIDDKRCVDKTYPQYWEHIEKYLGMTTIAPPPEKHADNADARIIFVIGMRGAGKTTLGSSASRSLGLEFFDLDQEIERVAGVAVREIAEQQGWDAFRKIETKTLGDLVARIRSQPSLSSGPSALISCGGGVVESDAARRLLAAEPLVIFVNRHIEDVKRYLASDSGRPSLLSDLDSIYARRLPHYERLSKHEQFIAEGNEDWLAIEAQFTQIVSNMVDRVSGKRTAVLKAGPDSVAASATSFICLNFPDIVSYSSRLQALAAGVDAIEVRADLLKQHDTPFLAQQLAVLRHSPFTAHLPVLWTVRSRCQGGHYEGDWAATAALLERGAKLGCDIIDVEALNTDGSINQAALDFVRRFRVVYPHVGLIASHHDVASNGGSVDELESLIDSLQQQFGQHIDVIKIVVTAASESDSVNLLAAVDRARSQSPGLRPVLALAMGARGRLTRVANRLLSPVTHALIDTPAAPGQLPVDEIQRLRFDLCFDLPCRFYLFGSPIGRSPSPRLHNTGFQSLFLKHTYELCDTESIDKVREVVNSPSFGGASVTIPLKTLVAPLLSSLSPAASAIGAVNTIVKRKDGSLYGDNTDYQGVYSLLHPLLPRSLAGSRALVLGAGGTSRAALYALGQLGFKGEQLIVFNPRTNEKADALAAEFNATAIHSLSPSFISSMSDLRVVVSTLPPDAQFELPAGVLESKRADGSALIVFDATYIPYNSALLTAAAAAGCRLVRGIDLLISQGVAAFDLWTGRANAACGRMGEVVKEQYLKEHATSVSNQ